MQRIALSNSLALRYGTFFYLYLMQGIPAGFALTALTNHLLAKGITSSAVGSFAAVVGFPWVIQFIWGPFIDRYQYSAIGHRKHWVLLSQLTAFAASLLLFLVDDPVQQLPLLTAIFCVHSVFASIQDASVDALAISVVPLAERGRLNAAMRGGFLLGIAFGAAVLSLVLNRVGYAAAVGVQSGLLLLFTLLTFFIRVAPNDPLVAVRRRATASKQQPEVLPVKVLFQRLWLGFSHLPHARLFGSILLVYLCFSVFIRSLNFFLIKKVGWSDEQLSVFTGSWGSVFSFLMILVGGILADKYGAKRLQQVVLWALGLFLVGYNLLLWFGPAAAIAKPGLIFWNLADPLFSVAAFPILMQLCRKEVEGSQFTAYMALINFSDVAGAFISGWLLRVVPAPVLGLGCGLVLLGVIWALRKPVVVVPLVETSLTPNRF